MMADDTRQDEQKLSLTARIENTERQLQQRWEVLDIRQQLLKDHVRDGLTSPTTLLAAAGVGFVIGDLTRGKRKEPVRKDSAREEAEDRGPVFSTAPFIQAAWGLFQLTKPILMAEMEKWLTSSSPVMARYAEPSTPSGVEPTEST